MTQQNLIIDADKGLVAIYSGPESADVEDNPLNHLDKTTFNSKLAYVGFEKVTKTYTIPATSGGIFRMERLNFGAHGKAFAPVCLPMLRGWNNGDGNPVDLPLVGGMLLDFYGQRPDDSGVLDYEGTSQDRWSRNPANTFRRVTSFDDTWQEKSLLVGAGADDTNLFLWYEQAVTPEGGDGASYPAFTLTIDFYVGDQSVDGTTGDALPPQLFDSQQTGVVMSASRLSASGSGDGAFDSNRQYFHAESVDPLFPIVTSDAIDFSTGGTVPNIYSRRAITFGPDWIYDLKSISGSPTVPALGSPTVQGVSF